MDAALDCLGVKGYLQSQKLIRKCVGLPLGNGFISGHESKNVG